MSALDPTWTGEPPCAALSACTDGLDVGEDYWLRADPIHLQPQRDDLIPFSVTDLDHRDAAALAKTINEHLGEDGLQLVVGAPQRWYLRLPAAPQLTTHPISRAIGKPLGAHLPSGPQASNWLQRLTEIQMLLHVHAVNASRESAGKLAVNALWLWGGGVYPKNLLSNVDAIYGNDEMSVGMAKACHTQHTIVPTGFAKLPSAGRVLAVLDETSMDELERLWFEPLLKALRCREVTRCDLFLWREEAWRIRVLPNDLWRFWRCRSPFAEMKNA